MEDRPAFMPMEVARLLHASAERMLNTYVERQGHKLSLMVRKSMATPNWLQMKEPRDVRRVVDVLMTELTSMEVEVSQLLDDSGRLESLSSSPSKREAGGLNTRCIERGVAKIFQEKMQIFGAVEFTQGSVLTGIVKIMLKSLVECVRLQTLGRAGCQQIQLDAHFLRGSLSVLVDDQGVVEMLLDEASRAASERSVDPTPMERSVMERILSNKRSKEQSQQP
ncbi:hypothetical protein CYMTET_17674 [Cymbomonas tetramitiformis]|uniref:Vacuolar protein sorting-associated protein 51 homolog n=1 Tax=Cymbomonas tetramitiformis TaxID=36881 RepID=A0AAE0L715_9CHLO|nr:hypothetical protein CYMTET_17674 [Cymbomonas tetramitiformis]